MIPNERKLCSYRCAACGDFTFPEHLPEPPVRQMACRICEAATFVRDLTAEELIELHALLATWRQVAVTAPRLLRPYMPDPNAEPIEIKVEVQGP